MAEEWQHGTCKFFKTQIIGKYVQGTCNANIFCVQTAPTDPGPTYRTTSGPPHKLQRHKMSPRMNLFFWNWALKPRVPKLLTHAYRQNCGYHGARQSTDTETKFHLKFHFQPNVPNLANESCKAMTIMSAVTISPSLIATQTNCLSY